MADSANDPIKEPEWLGEIHAERDRTVDELLKRADFAVHQRARISRIMFAFPTAAERIREIITAQAPDWLLNHPDVTRESEGAKPPDENQLSRRLVRTLMAEFSPLAHPLRRQRASIRPFRFLRSCLNQFAGKRPKTSSSAGKEAFDASVGRKRAREHMQPFRDLYEVGGPLHPRWEAGAPWSERHRDSIDPLMPYPPGSASNKSWFNLWRRPGDSEFADPVPVHELRLLWEAYPANQNFTAWEDWTDLEGENPMLAGGADDLRLQVDTTAIDSLHEWIEAWKPTLGKNPLESAGKILAISHMWSVPIKDIVPDLSPAKISDFVEAIETERTGSAAVSTIIGQVRAFALRSFPQYDQTRAHRLRDDLVLSVLGAGEAILVCDFRPYSRDAAFQERSARTLVVPITMQSDKLGRLFRRLIDIANYRVLALRDYQYSFTARDVIDAIGGQISREESQSRSQFIDGRRRRRPWIDRRDILSDRLNKWLDLSMRVAALNHVFNNGITGLHANAVEMRKLITSRIADIRETSVPGNQSLTAYLQRFHNALDFIESLNTKYLSVRERLDEMVNLTRAEISKYESNQNRIRTYWALGISSLLLLGSAYSNVLKDFSESDWAVFMDSAWLALIALIGALAVGRAVRFFLLRSPFAPRLPEDVHR